MTFPKVDERRYGDSTKDTYRVVEKSGEGSYTEKRSRFLAFARYVENEAEAKAAVEGFRKEYFDARHVCYAYVLGPTGDRVRVNDDGEPSGSAGKPILGQLVSYGVTQTLVVVVRYFGGVKLGTGGLAVAYKTAAAAALENAEIGVRLVTVQMAVAVPYELVDMALRVIRSCEAEVVSREYTDKETILALSVRQNNYRILREQLARIYPLRFVEETE